MASSASTELAAAAGTHAAAVKEPRGRSAPSVLRLALAVTVFENAAVAWASHDPARGLILDGLNAALVACLLVWAVRREATPPEALGLASRGLARSALWGTGAGVVMAGPAILFFAFPLVMPDPVRYGGYAGLEGAGFFQILVPRLLITHALLEEVLFRGIVQHRAISWLGPRSGIALTCGLFVVWHAVVSYRAVEGTNLTLTLPLPLLYAATAVPLAGAGLIFSLLRYATGNLAGPVLAHWIVNSLMLLALARG